MRDPQEQLCECRVCGRWYVYDRTKGHTRVRCNSCGSNRATYAERLSLKRKMVAYKGGRCSRCGFDAALEALCFHHIDPASRSFRIAGAHGRSWRTLQSELDKCELMCRNCHAELHIEKPVRGGRPAAKPGPGARRCAACGRSYDFDYRKGHGRYICNSCRSNGGGRAGRENLKRRLIRHKGGACQRCGYDRCLAALCFHHDDPSTKRFIFAGSHLRSWRMLLEEARKCLLVCQNCPAVIHAELRVAALMALGDPHT
jgi:hypothetical protein